MTAGKVVTLRVQPQSAANLALPVGGIVQELNIGLGQSVQAFDFTAFYAALGATLSNDPGTLVYPTSASIFTAPEVVASMLLFLRAEPAKGALDSAVAARANAYNNVYAHISDIAANMNGWYTGANAKSGRLQYLCQLAQTQNDQLQAAYTTDARQGVVKTTTSDLITTGETSSQVSATSGGTDDTSISTTETPRTTTTTTGSESGVTPEGQEVIQVDSSAKVTGSTGINGNDQDTENGWSSSTSSGTQYQTQYMVNTDYGYRVPSIEAEAQNQRAQISLIDELSAEYLRDYTVLNLNANLSNELTMLNLSIKQLQVAFLNTILLSPISGIVTARLVNTGDTVLPGQTLVRVEDNATVFLVGTIIYRGAITPNVSQATITTTAYGVPGQTLTMTGQIVAARGTRDAEDRWEIVVSCGNLDSSGDPLLPLHYSFDYDDTSVVIQ